MTENSSDPGAVRKTYRGWIPTISGALSFSVFGDTRHPSEAVFANVADDQVRYLAAYQFRNAADVLLPFRSVLAPFFLGIDGRIWFVFIAHTETVQEKHQYYLSGRAFMFTNLKRWKKETRPALAGFQTHLRSFLFKGSESLEQHAKQQHVNLIDYCTRTCSFYADVRVCRTGTTDISFPFPMQLSPDAPVLPADKITHSHVVHILAAQIFFFLKDIGHRHQHHDEATDQIVLLYETHPDDDDSWRNNTLYSIYRKVIQIKRDPHMTTFSDSLGLIAYAESFVQISRDENPKGTQPKYFAKETSESIRATQARVEREIRERQRKLDIFRNTVISVAGLLFSCIGLLKLSSYQSQVTPSPILTTSLEWILVYPIPAIGLLGLTVWLVIAFFSHRNSDVPTLSVKIVRAIQFLPRWLAATGLAALVLVSLYFFWRFLPTIPS